jgi:hypothetical protein
MAMPPDPNKKPIEELLERSARTRRTQFGRDPAMPNPMRARLQDEVARVASDSAPSLRRSWLAIAWPRLAMGAAIASVIAAVSVFWWRTHESVESRARLAMDQKASAPEISRAEPNDYPAAAAARARPAETDALEPKEKAAEKLAKVAPATQPTIQNFSQSIVAASNLRQQFSQAGANQPTAAAPQSAQTPKLLESFQVEQNGQDIRVIDGDGSTYAGKIEPLSRPDARKMPNKKTNVPNGEYRFRASGFNASLQRSVVFEGSYVAGAAAAPAKDDAALADKAEAQVQARIIGTAQVSGEPPVPVEAVAVPR